MTNKMNSKSEEILVKIQKGNQSEKESANLMADFADINGYGEVATELRKYDPLWREKIIREIAELEKENEMLIMEQERKSNDN